MKRLRNVLWVHGEQGHRPGGRKPRPETQTRSEGRRAGGGGGQGVQSLKGGALGVGAEPVGGALEWAGGSGTGMQAVGCHVTF